MERPPRGVTDIMQRRELLGSAAVVTATGLAGCSGVLGGGGGCSKPSSDLKSDLPSGGEYTRQDDVRTTSSNTKITDFASARYTGPDGGRHLFGIAEFRSSDVAKKQAGELEPGGQLSLGYILMGEYIYFAYGTSKKSVKALMAEAKPLNSGCIDSQVEWN